MNQMNCLGWRSLAVNLSRPRCMIFHNLLILQPFPVAHPWVREPNGGAERAGQSWDSNLPCNLCRDSFDRFHFQRNLQVKGTLPPWSQPELGTWKGCTMPEPGGDLGKWDSPVLTWVERGIPSAVFLCLLLSCPVGGWREDLEKFHAGWWKPGVAIQRSR